jgi:eukaryotic-like serine/threonine-protein kinase
VTTPQGPGRTVRPPSRGGRGSGRLLAVLATVAALLAVALIAALILIRPPPAPPEALVVPDVRGRRVADAVRELKVRGFSNLQLPAGFERRREHLVVAQRPAPGSRVPMDQEITLTVVRPHPRVRVPSVRGLQVRQAVERLRKAQLEVSPNPLWRDDPTVEHGRVIGTVPPAGTTADSGKTVRLVISLGNGGTPPPEVPGDLGPVAAGRRAPSARDA